MSAQSPYEVLKIPQNATLKDIKRSYKDLVRTYTPEHHPDKFMEIRAAYDILMSTEMNAQEVFPIYKKPLDFLKQSTSNTAQGSNKALLGQFFETPYDTDTALKKLFS
jgi:DnaJ-class molecular chaperone